MSLNNASAPPYYTGSPGADVPAAAGHHCIARPIDAVGFIRLPRAQTSFTGAARQEQCAGAAVVSRWHLGRRGLLAAAALCAWQAAAGQTSATPAPKPETVTVHGVVLDDSLNVPVPGLFLYLNDTKYGAITDAQGQFTFRFPTGWKPVRGGVLTIKVATAPFTFKMRRVLLDWRTHDLAQPLTLRLASAPGRGRPNLHGYVWMAPPVPPPVYPASSHAARP